MKRQQHFLNHEPPCCVISGRHNVSITQNQSRTRTIRWTKGKQETKHTRTQEIYVVWYTGCVSTPRREGTNQSTILNKDYKLRSPHKCISLSLLVFLIKTRFYLPFFLLTPRDCWAHIFIEQLTGPTDPMGLFIKLKPHTTVDVLVSQPFNFEISNYSSIASFWTNVLQYILWNKWQFPHLGTKALFGT